MRRFFEILTSSMSLTWQEFKSHKVRTLLSLTGVAFGIFCIIGVLATVDSLQYQVQQDIKALGSSTIYIDKWEYGGGPDNPWWKYVKRPSPTYEEMRQLKERVSEASNVAFKTETNGTIEYEDDQLTNVTFYGITEDFINIQPQEIQYGRYFLQSDFDHGNNVVVAGYTIAEKLFGNPANAIGKHIRLKGKVGIIGGVLKKKGESMLQAWDFDNCLLLTRGFMKQLVVEKWSSPTILVQAREGVPMAALKDQLLVTMRSLHKLKPTEDNDFSLNDIDTLSSFMDSIFSGLNKGGWAIALLSLIVGMFGVANIMFVTVRERTPQIGLKKAIGAKKSTILTEFLLESAFLCIMGGLLGLAAVFLLTLLSGIIFHFNVFISPGILGLAISICIIVGVLAGIIPASAAARMDPVVAIRSK